MIAKLAYSSLRHDPRGALAPAVLIAAAGFLTSLAVQAFWSAISPAGLAAARNGPTGTTSALVSVSVVALILGIGVPTCLSVSTVSALAVRSSQDIYATWRLAGVSPRQVRRAARLRIQLTAVLSALVGYYVSLPFLQFSLDLLIASTSLPIHLTVEAGAFPAGISVALVLTFATIAAKRPSRVASTVKPIVLFQEGVQTSRRSRFRRCFSVLLLLGSVTLGLAVLTAPNPDVGSMMTLFLGFSLVLILWLEAPAVMSPFVRLWTSAFAKTKSPGWYLARRYAIAQLTATNATITPLAVGTAVLSVYFSSLSTWQLATGNGQSNSSNVLQGLVLFGPGATLAGVASLVTLFTVNRSRSHHIGVLRATGVCRRVLYLSLLFESIIYAGSALLISTAIATITTLTYAISMVLSGYVFAFAISFSALFTSSIIGLFGILISLFIPARRSMRLDVGTAMHSV